MSRADSPSLDGVDFAIRDAEDLILVAETVLNSQSEALSPMLRDALATVLRLGRGRAAEARHEVTALCGARR